MVEKDLINTTGVPVLEAVLGFFAKVERNALRINGAAVLDANGMRQLIDQKVVRIGRETFFVALQRLAFSDTVTGKLHTQTERDTVARALRKFLLHVDQAGGTRADETPNVSFP